MSVYFDSWSGWGVDQPFNPYAQQPQGAYGDYGGDYDSRRRGWTDDFASTPLPEEPDHILVVNSLSSGASASLCADCTSAHVVAIDVEWVPDLQWESNNPISVMQLAFPQSRRVYVVQLERIDRQLPPEVQMLLVNPAVVKVGFGVDHSDVRKLFLSGIAVKRDSLVDIQDLCTEALGATSWRPTSLRHATNAFLGFPLDKDKRLSCSDWASSELTPAQVRYAALDAWVALRLYGHFGGEV